MSIDVGIYCTLTMPKAKSHLYVVEALIGSGWEPNDNGFVVYLPKEDNNRFDWKSVGIDRLPDVLHELDDKCRAQETIGLVLTWETSGTGGEFLVSARGELTLSPTLNRVILPQGNVTDVSWYIARIALAFERASLAVEDWKWIEGS